MIDLNSIRKDNLIEANDKITAKLGEGYEPFSEKELSSLLFRKPLDPKCNESITAHLQAIKCQIEKVLSSSYQKDDVIFLEFSKSLTLFDDLTQAIGLTGHTRARNYIASQHLYCDAISSYQKYIVNLHTTDLDFAYIPMKLRLAIEFYFKNMLGFAYAQKKFLAGKRKDKIVDYPLSISELLRFYGHKKYNKYVKLPLDVSLIQDINYWSNKLVHTGIHSYAWQNLTAVDFLKPLFNTVRNDGSRHLEGFNYLNLDYEQEKMVEDLNKFLSNQRMEIKVLTYQRGDKPIEGAYY